jgi:hypothetical protein
MPDERYYTWDDPETGVARDALESLPIEEQVEYMKVWFGRYFEDPAQETPYNGREGGYLYIHGGPYDAEEEVRGEFEGVASEEAIEAAVEEVTSDGTYDWAPTSNHPDRIDEGRDEYDEDETPAVTAEALLRRIQEGAKPTFADVGERQQREMVLERLNDLERQLTDLIPQPGEIGHNRPPGSISDEQVAEITGAIADIRSQMGRPQPDVEVVARAGGILERFGRWLASKTEIAVDAFAKGLGDTMGKAAGVIVVGMGTVAAAEAAGLSDDLLGAVHTTAESVVHWLTMVL